jgi:seryl-tRNA synthetase
MKPSIVIVIILILLLIFSGWYIKILNDKVEKSKIDLEGKNALEKDLKQKIEVLGNTVTEKNRQVNNLIEWKKKYAPDEGKKEFYIKENEELKKQIPILQSQNQKLQNQLAEVLTKLGNAKTPEDIAKLKEESERIKKELEESNQKLKEAWGKLQQIDVNIQTTGFTVRIGMDLIYNGKFYGGLDCKWFFFDRFSLMSGVALDLKDYIDFAIKPISLSYHVNGFVPESWHFDNLELELLLLYIINANQLKPGIGLRTNF